MEKTNNSSGPDISRFKLVVYFKNQPDKKGHVFYSFLRDEKKGYQTCVDILIVRTIEKWTGKYNTAILYDLKQDKVVRKYINGERTI